MQATLAVVLWWAVYWQVADGYDPGTGVFAATLIAWGYVLVSTFAVYLLNARASRAERPPHAPSGRWPGAKP